MSKSKETFNKKEKEKKRLKKKQDKQQKKEERKANSDKGKSLNEMLAYVDENGDLSSTPPDPKKKKLVREEDILTSVPKHIETEAGEEIRTGVVTFFNESKGYGFIKDQQTQNSIFVHINALHDRIKESDKVVFEIEMGHKGPSAKDVKVIT